MRTLAVTFRLIKSITSSPYKQGSIHLASFQASTCNRFAFLCDNQHCHSQTEATAGFSVSNWSKSNLAQSSHFSWKLWDGERRCQAEFFNLRNCRHFGLWFNYRQCYAQMEITAGFNASKRSKYTLPQSSVLVLMCQQVVKFAQRNSEIRTWENVFDGRATTSGRIDKWRPQLDSACRIGLKSHPHEILTVVGDGLSAG